MQDEYLKLLPDPFQQWLNGRRIEEVECIISDLAGVSRGKAMPSNKFSRQEQMFMPLSTAWRHDRYEHCFDSGCIIACILKCHTWHGFSTGTTFLYGRPCQPVGLETPYQSIFCFFGRGGQT